MLYQIALEDIEKHAESVYEAVVIIAKRARQINDEQKQLVEREMRELMADTKDDLLDDDQPREPIHRPFMRLPRPTTQALQEFLEGKLRYTYVEREEEKPAEGAGEAREEE
ncbi:MAG: DNA-directed RNA polymerase subunit omega [candidate division KSB1 bacterium]|nr:DNA-directed RNA polymerase subunit omega [candidate division KSB1 bacterium]MDZ7338568.1 DNA-directed RNA polymerase subunit omega [candidate division KSB1 bacterium]